MGFDCDGVKKAPPLKSWSAEGDLPFYYDFVRGGGIAIGI
jgi:hypothetical protein